VASEPNGLQEKVDPFLLQVQTIITANLKESDFDMPQLEQILGMSRSQVFRKIKAITGESTISLIRNTRLQKAKELLATTQLSISEVAYSVGFTAPNYFARSFIEAFGLTPSDYRKSIL
jgi:AraC-like DNA-binding protein